MRTNKTKDISQSRLFKDPSGSIADSNRLYHIILFIFIIFLVVPSFFMVHFSFSEIKPPRRNSAFPDFSFQNILTKEENRYLGSSQKHILSFRKIHGDIFIVEVFSTYCMACPKNVPVLNAVYSAIANNTDLKDKVKIVGIAVGNTDNEIKTFRKSYGVHYPVLSDYHFTFHKVIGNPRVPYTIFIKRISGRKKAVIFHTHQGVFDSPEDILRVIQDEFHEKN